MPPSWETERTPRTPQRLTAAKIPEIVDPCCGVADANYWYLVTGVDFCRMPLAWAVIARTLLFRGPFAVLALCLALVLLHYVSEQSFKDDNLYIAHPRNANVWYTPFTANLIHVDKTHLWTNVIMFAVAGWMLELTEGHLQVFEICIGSGVTAVAFHGVWAASGNGVCGFSGAVYGVVWSQLALLALNWKEMPGRWLRTLLLFFLFFIEGTLELRPPPGAWLCMVANEPACPRACGRAH